MKTHVLLIVLSMLCVELVPAQVLTVDSRSELLSRTENKATEGTPFTRRGFSLQSEIPLYDPGETKFYAGGSIDSRLAYFDLTFGGDIGDKDVLIRTEYGMNIFYFRDEPDTKLCASLGVGAIIGIHAEDWATSRYEWFFQLPFFVAGLKYHFDRYSVTIGWKQNYAVFGKMKDGKEIEEEVLKRGAVELKLCVY